MARHVGYARKHPRLYERLSVPGAAATGHRRSANLDIVRAVAALMVLVGHASYLSLPSGPGSHGIKLVAVSSLGNGVWLFFALSGYLIAGPFVRALMDGRSRPRVGRYAVRRSARILPAYWVALAAIIAVSASVRHWWQVPVHALLLQDFVPGQATELLFVAWTLSIEAMFYAFVPLAAWLVWRVAGRRAVSLNALAVGVLVLWAASLFWRMGIYLAYSPQDFETVGGVPALVRVLHGTLPGFLLAFCPGILIFLAETPAAQERRGPFAAYRWLRGRPLACAVAAVGLLVVLTRAEQRGLAAADLATALLTIPAGLGVIAVMGEGSVRHMLARLLGPVGLISYGVYLWHAVARQAILHHGGGIVPGIGDGYHSWPLHSGVLLIVTLPLALASWLVVERPLLRRTTSWDRAGGDARATSAQPVPAAAAVVRS